MVLSRSREARILRQVQKPHFEVALKETHILRVMSDKEFEYGAKEVEQVVREVALLAGDKKYLVLIDTGPFSNITFDALKVLASPEAMGYAYAKAYVIHTLSQRLMANFYQQVFKPRIPVKFFSSQRVAEAWLLKNYRHLF